MARQAQQTARHRTGSSDLSDAPSDVEIEPAVGKSKAGSKQISNPQPSGVAAPANGSKKRKAIPSQQDGRQVDEADTRLGTPSKRRKAKTAAIEDTGVKAVQQGAEGPSASGAPLGTLKRSSGSKVVAVREANGIATTATAEEIDEVVTPPGSAKKIKRQVKQEVKVEAYGEDAGPYEGNSKTSQVKAEAPVKAEDEPAVDKADKAIKAEPAKPKRKRKTKEEKEAEAMPLAARTVGSKIFVGAHVSGAGGVHSSITNASHIGANAFALFLKSQRKWENPALKDEHRDSFKALCVTHSYLSKSHIVPHGSYLVNLAQSDAAKAKQAYDSFLDDLQRCETLGVRLYNFHPGNTGGEPRAEAIGRIADRLNAAHRATPTVVTLLENMAASPAGNTIGGCFEDLRDVISLVQDKSRVGVCFDTCHAFAAGFDLRTPEAFRATFGLFDRVVGGKYLMAVHLNDSKAPFASHRDLHQNIGRGFIGLRAFHTLVNEPRFWGIPLVLETPLDMVKNEQGKEVEDKGVWAREIKMLEEMVGMDAEGEALKEMERELSERGAAERMKHQEQFDRKQVETEKKAAKGKGRGASRKMKPGDGDSSSSSSDGE